MTRFRSTLSTVKGMGAAGNGAHHFWQQRLTAVGLIPLVLWLGFSLASLPDAGYAAIEAWIQHPFKAVLLLATLNLALWHGQLGVQVIVEDYVSSPSTRLALIVAIRILAMLGIIMGSYAILRIALGDQ
jgi:succinate dehydrogenase / fumarate reductase membrane anchor subunit